MLKNKTIAVVVPAYNEEHQIAGVLKGIPKFVDRIIVVNDCSKDKTAKAVEQFIKTDKIRPTRFKSSNKKAKYNKFTHAEKVLKEIDSKDSSKYTPHTIINNDAKKSRVVLINHLRNAIVGAAIATGYKWCRDNEIDCTAVMAGDGQMDPSELESICLPVVNGEVDYTKANRLKHRSAFFVIPKVRFFGNSILSLLTKVASGYWHVSDTQTGYTAISLAALKAIRIHDIYPSYGCPNDILVKLNIAFCTVKEIDSKPVYNVGEKSKMKELKVIPRISWLLLKSFFYRLYVKYLFRDFHPLFLLYHLSFFLLIINTKYTIDVIASLAPNVTLPLQSMLIFIFLFISGFQSLFFAMWMDMIDNERLQK